MFFNKDNLNVVIIFFVIFLWTMSALMVMSTVTIYHESILHLSKSKLGAIQSISSLSTYITKFFFGIMVDIFHNFRFLLILGSVMTTISKPLFAYVHTFQNIFYLRTLERLIKGIRGAPVDTYISLMKKQEKSGQVFAFKQIAVTLGAVIGCVISSLMLYFTNNNFIFLFKCSFIPSLIATFLLFLVLRNPLQSLQKQKKKRKKFSFYEIKEIPSVLWLAFFLIFGITTTRFGETFLGHRFYEAGVPIYRIPLTYIYYDLPFALISIYMVRVFDHVNWKKLLLISILFLNITHLLLFTSNNYIVLAIGSAFGGLHMGTSQGLFLTMVSKYTPPHIRGTTFAILYTMIGLGLFAGGQLAGTVSQAFNSWRYCFMCGFFITAFLFILVLILFYFDKNDKKY